MVNRLCLRSISCFTRRYGEDTKKAQGKFEIFRQNLISEQTKAGAIQAFEYCYELAWKFMRKFLISRDIEVYSPKDTIRQAGLEGIIADAEIWFDFAKKRNLTVHTYDEDNADEIIAIFGAFSKELADLILSLEKINAAS